MIFRNLTRTSEEKVHPWHGLCFRLWQLPQSVHNFLGEWFDTLKDCMVRGVRTFQQISYKCKKYSLFIWEIIFSKFIFIWYTITGLDIKTILPAKSDDNGLNPLKIMTSIMNRPILFTFSDKNAWNTINISSQAKLADFFTFFTICESPNFVLLNI